MLSGTEVHNHLKCREREREVEVMDKDWNKINTLLVADCKLKEIHMRIIKTEI